VQSTQVGITSSPFQQAFDLSVPGPSKKVYKCTAQIHKKSNDLINRTTINQDFLLGLLHDETFTTTPISLITTMHLGSLTAQSVIQLHPINPFTDKQLDLLGTVPEQVCHFSSFYIFVYDAQRSAGEQLAN